MLDLMLVRHGETVWNVEHRFQGQKDSPLTPLGRRQASALARAVASHDVTALYSSDLGRALETARAIQAFQSVEVTVRPALREIGFGEWEGRSIPELEGDPRSTEQLAGWRHDPSVHRPPGAEGLVDFACRVDAALESITGECREGMIIVVSHAAWIRSAAGSLLGLPAARCRRLTLRNGSVTRLRLGGTEPALIEMGALPRGTGE